MKLFPFIFPLLIVASCSNQPKEDHANDSPKNGRNSTTYSKNEYRDTIKLSQPDTFKIPSKFFVSLISLIDSFGFISDTNRIKKVGYYFWTIKLSPIIMIKNIPFYKMNMKTNMVFDSAHYKEGSSDLTNFKTLNKVKHITGFYFRDKVNSDLITDAFIEEWEFENSTIAEKAEQELQKIYMYIYFNSFAHVFRKNDLMYTFYSRSDWDATKLEKMYKEILKRSGSPTKYSPPIY